MKRINVAIDGPSGVGKSSAADLIAEKYGMSHLDTGSMYRAAAYALHQAGIEPVQNTQLEQALKNLDLDVKDGHVYIDGQDVSGLIRTPEVSLMASQYSALPAVRSYLVAMQQKIAARKGFILDGRDICDVVLPDAEVKIYLDASAQARAQRRYKQDLEAGKSVSYEQVLKDIEARDYQDSTRAVSPLRISKQAVVVDSSSLNLQQTADAISRIVDQALGENE